jgi:membrane-associated phospholipid phosphatase
MSWIDGGYVAHGRTDRRRSFDRAAATSAPAAAAGSYHAAGDGLVRVTRRQGTRWIIPVGLTACYALFALAVHLGMLDALDMAVRRASRPGDVWGLLQIRAVRVVNWLPPARFGLLLLVIVALLSLLRRSLRPLVVVAAVCLPVAIVTLATKWVMAHSESRATRVGHGSFPSGHTVSVIIVFGLVMLLLRPRARWGWLLPAVMGCAMGAALVLGSVHPATDVIGAGLLAAAALVSASATRLGQWASHRQRRSVE